MRAIAFTGTIVLMLQACVAAQNQPHVTKARPTSRPATAPASRPTSPDAPLTQERRKEFNLALKDARQSKNAKIEAARQKLHADMEKKEQKAENVAEKAQDNEQIAAAKRNTQLRRRHRIRALNQQQKVLKNDRIADNASENLKASQEQYTAAYAALTRLEEVWRACREYAIDKEYEQWTLANAAKHRAETDYAKVNTKLLTPEMKVTVQLAEGSVKEEIAKLK